MNTLPLSLYKVLEYGLGGQNWQEFVDHYNEKYNDVQIDGFEFDPVQLDYTFAQLISSAGVKTLPAYVDPESPGYEVALREIEGKTGNIPTQKQFYRLNRVQVRRQLQLLQRVGAAALTPEMQNVFLGLLDESTDGLIGSYYNALTHQRMRIVSTGKFVIDTDNNPRGLKGITLDFNIPSTHYQTLTGTALWWTSDEHLPANEGSASDPILDIKNRVKEIRRKYHYLGEIQMELAKDLWDDLMTHTAVLKRIGHNLYPQVTDDATVVANAQNESEERLKAIFQKLVGVDVIKPRDSFAYVDKPGTNSDGEKDLVTVEVENFKATNISFIPKGKIGTIQGVEPLTLGYDADKVASYDGGRLKLTQRAVAETHSIYIESEAAQLCVPNKPQFMFISTVTV